MKKKHTPIRQRISATDLETIRKREPRQETME